MFLLNIVSEGCPVLFLRLFTYPDSVQRVLDDMALPI